MKNKSGNFYWVKNFLEQPIESYFIISTFSEPAIEVQNYLFEDYLRNFSFSKGDCGHIAIFGGCALYTGT